MPKIPTAWSAGLAIALAAGLGGCATKGGIIWPGSGYTEFRVVNVSAPTPAKFHYVRADIWRELAKTDPQPRVRFARMMSHGPFESGSEVPMMLRSQYMFVPVCGGVLSWDKLAFKGVPREPVPIEISC